MIFSKNLKQKRLEKGLTQQEVADNLGINRVTYTNWEKGNREPNFRTVMELAKIFGVSVDYLLGAEVIEEVEPTNDLKATTQQLLTATVEYQNTLDKKIYSTLQLLEFNKVSKEEVATELKNLSTITRLRYQIDVSQLIFNLIEKWVTFEDDKTYLISQLVGNTLETTQSE